MAPLLLLSLVENAFKHGASGEINKPKIEIKLEILNARLKFRVWNTKPQSEQADPTSYKKGIGFSNIKKQLELTYPDHYQLNVQNGNKSYCVMLDIKLKKDTDYD